MKDKYFIPNQEYKKCAPSITFSEGSCFSLKELLYIAKSYNNHLKNQKVTDIKRYIIVSDSKIDLISELSKKIKECDSDQLCWLKWASKDTEKQTFRPKGPTIKSQWLSTTDINNILDQYEHKYDGFLSLGAVPVDFWKLNLLSSKKNFNLDEMCKDGINKLGMVINLDEHWQSGSHWVALFANLKDNKIYFSDSYGIKPTKRIIDFIKTISVWCHKRNILNSNDNNLDTESIFLSSEPNKYEQIMDIRYNKTRHQRGNSECGVYSVNFILRLLKGDTFDEIISKRIPDSFVQDECRKIYFRFM